MLNKKENFHDHNAALTCVIIDDEVENLDLLEYMLSQTGFAIEILDKIKSSEKAIQLLKETTADIVFLDIQMPVLTGFDILERVGECDFHVVFVTAYDQFAIQALRVSAFDYLLKPVNQEALNKVLYRLTQKISSDNNKINSLVFNRLAGIKFSESRKKLLPGINDYINLNLDEVIYFEADSVTCRAYLKDGKKLFINLPLKTLEAELEVYGFFRVHKSYLINLNEISRVSKKDGITVIMQDERSLPISRIRKSGFLEKIQLL